MNTVFLVIAYRMGQERGYNYPVGIFSTVEEALKEARFHREYRGGKYDHKIFQIEVGKGYDAEEAEVVDGTGNFIIKEDIEK